MASYFQEGSLLHCTSSVEHTKVIFMSFIVRCLSAFVSQMSLDVLLDLKLRPTLQRELDTLGIYNKTLHIERFKQLKYFYYGSGGLNEIKIMTSMILCGASLLGLLMSSSAS